MKKSDFIEEIEKYRPLIKGKGRDIADSIEMDYVKFSNYIRGAGNEVEIYEQIVTALANYKEELVEYINNNW